MSPGEVDVAVLRRHLLSLRGALEILKLHQGRTVENLLEDPEERWVVERGLQVCAQNALDIATHIAASAARDVPDYASAIDQLASLGVIPGDFATRFRSVAGFRNVLVHGYLEVDIQLLHRLLNENLSDFNEFVLHVEQFVSG